MKLIFIAIALTFATVASGQELPVSGSVDVSAIMQRIDALESRLDALEQSPTPEPQPKPQPTSDNVGVIRNAGHPVPPASGWWVEQPTPDELIAALVDPVAPFCSGRMWLRRGDDWESIDADLLFNRKPDGPHTSAAQSHYRRWQGNIAAADQLMQDARDWYFEDRRDKRIESSMSCRELGSMVFAFDWIDWRSAEKYETAFAFLLKKLQAKLATERKSGYWDANRATSHHWIEFQLAIAACGVNPNGQSDAWARDRLAKLDTGSTDGDNVALHSGFRQANMLSLLSRRGGGREYGQTQNSPGAGGYETYYFGAAVVQVEALDTATGRKWDLTKRNLYIQARWLGLLTERDHGVCRTTDHSQSAGALSVFARLLGETEAGRSTAFYLGTDPQYRFEAFQALAGKLPTPVVEPTPIVGRIGSRWHYRADRSKPESTFRMWVACRDIEHFRYGANERTFQFCVGNVGLIDGHANRANPVPILANGIAIRAKGTNGEPIIADPQFWGDSWTRHPYWSPDRVYDVDPVLTDSAYLVGGDGPVEQNGVWKWSADYSGQISPLFDYAPRESIKRVTSDYTINPAKQRMEIIDTVRVDDPAIYVGWHFSPSHVVEFRKDGFDFGDGFDLIRVTIEPLGDFNLEPTRRTEFKHDGYTLPLEWHRPPRMPENIGYTPTKYLPEYRVKVTVEVR